MKKIVLLTLILAFTSCKDVKKPKNTSIENPSDIEKMATNHSHPGKRIMEAECYICHNPKASPESMIAPPMILIKNHYIGDNMSKEEFTEDLIKWVNDPETESKIPNALLEFGNMPYIPYPDDAIAQIAEYIYDYDIERPSWYEAVQKVENGKGKWISRDIISKKIRDHNAKKGMAMALAAKTALGQNLVKAISSKGTVGAIEFCNTQALPITDSVSVMKNAVIKRISDKPRNPDNAANEEEQGYITYYKKLIAAGKEPKPIVKTEDGEVDFYFPITTNTMCLQCHGKPNEQIRPEILATLRNLYPADRAIGYGENEVRGLWAINFDAEQY